MKRTREKTVCEDSVKKNRLFAGAMTAALVAAVAVFIVLLQIEKSVLTQYEKGIVCTAVESIPRGQNITAENAFNYFQSSELDKSCIPDTAVCSWEELEGLYAVFDIDRGTLLTRGMFEEPTETGKEITEPVIAGFKAEDIFQVVGGVLRAGDRIHIYTVSGEGETVLAWENIFVQGVFDQTGGSIACDDRTTAAQRINVYLDKNDIEAFYSGLAKGSLRAVKVLPRG